MNMPEKVAKGIPGAEAVKIRPKAIAKFVRIRIFDGGNKTSRTRNIHAPRGSSFTESGIQGLLEQTADNLEKARPHLSYRLVELSPSSFNFIVDGEVSPVPSDSLAEGACL